MSGKATIGQFEQIVLAAVASQGDNAYGISIHAAAGELSSPKAVSLGAVYATLDRLEDKKLIRSWLSEPTRERGGRSKRHYALTAEGEGALRESVRTARRICDTVERLWSTALSPSTLQMATFAGATR